MSGSGLAQSSTTSLQSFCAPFTANVDTTTWQTAQTVLNDTSVFSILNAGATGQLLGNWPPVEGSPGPRNATMLALTNKAVGELAQSLGQPADGSTTFLNPNSQTTINYLKALITPLYQELKALDVYGDDSLWANGTTIPFGSSSFQLVQEPLVNPPNSSGYGGQPLVYMRLNGTTLPQALLNPPFIVQGYITASGGRCALYRQIVYPIDSWPFKGRFIDRLSLDEHTQQCACPPHATFLPYSSPQLSGSAFCVPVRTRFMTLVDQPGRIIEVAQLLNQKPLGEGAFSLVKVAELRNTGRAQGSGRSVRRQRKVLVAVKHMKQDEMSSFEDCAEFDDECALLRKLCHRHIARYIGHSEGCEPEEDIMATLGTSLKARFLVQEYIDCGSLKDLALRQAS
eukprot:jgi/Astpho2/8186/Aster-x0348